MKEQEESNLHIHTYVSTCSSTYLIVIAVLSSVSVACLPNTAHVSWPAPVDRTPRSVNITASLTIVSSFALTGLDSKKAVRVVGGCIGFAAVAVRLRSDAVGLEGRAAGAQWLDLMCVGAEG